MKSLKYAVLAAAMISAACGNVGPNDDAATTGSYVRITSISIEGADSVNTKCVSNGALGYQATGASVTIENSPVGKSAGARVTMKTYIVSYAPIDGGPALTPHDEPLEMTMEIAPSGTLTADVWAFPIGTKMQYFNATTNTTMFITPKLYRIDYEFTGVTEYGDPVEALGSTTVQLGNTFVTNCD